AGERAGPDRLAARRQAVADAVVLELLRRWSLLVDVIAFAFAKGLIHLRARDVESGDGGGVEAAPMTGVLEHGQRLAAVVDQHAPALELVPGERRVGPPARQAEPVLLLDLGKLHRPWRL